MCYKMSVPLLQADSRLPRYSVTGNQAGVAVPVALLNHYSREDLSAPIRRQDHRLEQPPICIPTSSLPIFASGYQNSGLPLRALAMQIECFGEVFTVGLNDFVK